MSDPDIFIAPCSREHKDSTIRYFRDTVLNGIDPNQYTEFSEMGYVNSIPIWGVTDSKRTTWEQMDEGDVVLFYTKSGTYTHIATVKEKLSNERLARHIWEPFDEGRTVKDIDQPWSNMFILQYITQLDIPADELHGALGYNMEYPLGFMRPSDSAHSKLRNKFGSVESFLGHFGHDSQQEPTSKNTGPEEDDFSSGDLRPRTGTPTGQIEDDIQTIEVTINPAEIQRKEKKHEDILNEIEERLTSAGFDTGETTRSDLIATRGKEIVLGEGKTIHEGNEKRQIRSALGQLLEYRYHDIRIDTDLDDDPLLFLVLSQKPSDYYAVFLSDLQREGIYTLWIDEERIEGFGDSVTRLEDLL